MDHSRSPRPPVSRPFRVPDLRAARRGNRVAHAVAWALLGIGGMTMPAPAPVLAATPADSTAEQDYAIGPGRLSDVLAEFAAAAGVPLSYDPQLLTGRQSSGLRGRFTVREGFSQLLAGSGYELDDRGNGAWSLRPAARTLGTVHVEDSALLDDPGRTEGSRDYAAPSTGTAFKLPLTLRETPQTVTVIPQAVIEDFSLTDMRSILQFTPGVYVSAERSSQAYYFLARGYELQSQYDGLPSPTRMGGRGMTGLDPAVIDRVEVLHGASGLLSGPGSPGGTVNILRKTPTAQPLLAVEMAGTSWGGLRGTADISGPIGDTGLGGRLVGVIEKQESFVDHVGARQSVLYGVLEKRIGEHTSLVAGINLEQIQDASYGAHYGLPAEIDGSPIEGLSRSRNYGATWSRQNDLERTAFVRAQHLFASGWEIRAQLTSERFDTRALESNPGRPRDAATMENIYLYSQIEEWNNGHLSLDLYAQGAVTLFGRRHELMLGFNGTRKEHDGASYVPPAPLATIDLDTWDPRNAPDPFSQGMAFSYGYTGDFEQYGVFGGGRFSLHDNLHLILGSRLSWTEQKWDEVTDTREKGVATPYAGLVWDFSRHISAYASYSDIFEPHSVGTRDIEGNVLSPRRGENHEVGLKLEAAGGRLNGALAFFRLDQTNLAEPDFSGEAPGICGGLLDPCSKASGLVRSQGFELSLTGEVATGWQVYGGYTQLNHKHRTGDSAGQRYDTTAPRRLLNVAATYSSPDDRWTVGASARYQSRIFLDDVYYFAPEQAFLVQQKGHTVAGLFGGVKLSPALRVNAAIDNLFDRKYWSGISWPLHGQVFGDPRRISLTLRAEF